MTNDLDRVKAAYNEFGRGLNKAASDYRMALVTFATSLQAGILARQKAIALDQARVEGRATPDVATLLAAVPPGMSTGTCGDQRHASQHPPHVAHDERLGDYWCVGGWVRADGTIPMARGNEWGGGR